MKTTQQIGDKFNETIRDIKHSCEVIDGKRKKEDHCRCKPLQDIADMLGGGFKI